MPKSKEHPKKKGRDKLGLVSVCILTYNRKKEVLKTIEYVKASLYKNYEIVVVDNVSTDGTSEAVARKFPDVVLIRNPHNNGIAGWNQSFKRARGNFLLALDDDSHPEKDTLGKIVAAFRDDKNLDIIACNILNFTSRKSAFPFIKASQNIPIDQYDFIGCGFAMRKNMLKKVGYFSEKLFMYGHETEYSIRAIEKGCSIKLFPDIITLHRVSELNRTSGRSLYYCTRNFFLIAWLYFPFLYAINVTFAILLENSILAVRDKDISPFLKGVLSWFSAFPWALQHRKTVSWGTIDKFNRYFPFSLGALLRRSRGIFPAEISA